MTKVKIFAGMIILGLVITGIAYTPWLNPPQCPGTVEEAGYTCIIGANIGAGLVWLLGLGLALAGAIALTALFVYRAISPKTKHSLVTLLITLVIMACIIVTARYCFTFLSVLWR